MKRSFWFSFTLCACLLMGLECAIARAQGMSFSLQHDAAVTHLVEACRYPTIFRNLARSFIARSKTPLNDNDAKFQMMERRIASALPEQLAPSIVSAFNGHISTQDAEEVADIFESPAGRKIIAGSLQANIQPGDDFSMLSKRFGLTDVEKKTFARFVQTPAWLHYRQMVTDRNVASAIMINVIHSALFTPEEQKSLLGPNG